VDRGGAALLLQNGLRRGGANIGHEGDVDSELLEVGRRPWQLAVLTKKNKKIKQIRRTRIKGERERIADEWFSPEGCQDRRCHSGKCFPIAAAADAALEHEFARSCGRCGVGASHG
jgi:hypothetical protein